MVFYETDTVLRGVLARLYEEPAQEELVRIGDCTFDWRDRVADTCNLLVPELVRIAPDLITECEASFNSAAELSNLLGEKAKQSTDSKEKEWLDKCIERAARTKYLISHLESQQVSAEIQRIVSADLSGLLYSNGNSIYPDFVRKDFDYSFLPFQNRKKPVDGPCLKGKTKPAPNPSNVPDGLELKTNKGSKIKVDAHGAHAGLHVGVTWELRQDQVKILGVYVAYIRILDHKLSGGNVKITTRKASFGHDHFTPICIAD